MITSITGISLVDFLPVTALSALSVAIDLLQSTEQLEGPKPSVFCTFHKKASKTFANTPHSSPKVLQ
jgi:hypothetical protein